MVAPCVFIGKIYANKATAQSHEEIYVTHLHGN